MQFIEQRIMAHTALTKEIRENIESLRSDVESAMRSESAEGVMNSFHESHKRTVSTMEAVAGTFEWLEKSLNEKSKNQLLVNGR